MGLELNTPTKCQKSRRAFARVKKDRFRDWEAVNGIEARGPLRFIVRAIHLYETVAIAVYACGMPKESSSTGKPIRKVRHTTTVR